ncbi:MAG TPA: peptidylprolyl isomerase [Candidatus Paceibacterota bacterium]
MQKTIIGIAIIFVIGVGTVVVSKMVIKKENTISEEAAPSSEQLTMKTATLETTMGDIVVELYEEDAPRTVQNFETLIQKGFYNGLVFHRVIGGFMIQGGDPSGNGTGGPGYIFEDELNSETPSYKEGYKKGVLAMANRGPNTNGSQFFIMLKDTPLPHSYTIFGKVLSGQSVVDAIGAVQTDASDKPLVPVAMEEVRMGK